MTLLPSLTGKELAAKLKKAGFEVIRVKGSHHFLRHADGRSTVVPVHAGETIGPAKFSAPVISIESSSRNSSRRPVI
ncbi:MAG: type II toxin-antitoxin system HicA family toxin [Gammaproteobacteria bacterium]